MCELDAHCELEQDELPNLDETLPGERRAPRPDPTMVMLEEPVAA